MRYEPKHDCYAKLVVDDDATATIIRRAFHLRSRLVHPDGHRDPDLAAKEFAALSEAYEVLSNPVARREYDEARRAHHLRACEPEIQRRVAAALERGRMLPAQRPEASAGAAMRRGRWTASRTPGGPERQERGSRNSGQPRPARGRWTGGY